MSSICKDRDGIPYWGRFESMYQVTPLVIIPEYIEHVGRESKCELALADAPSWFGFLAT